MDLRFRTADFVRNFRAANRLNKGSNAARLRTYFCGKYKAWHMTRSFH